MLWQLVCLSKPDTHVSLQMSTITVVVPIREDFATTTTMVGCQSEITYNSFMSVMESHILLVKQVHDSFSSFIYSRHSSDQFPGCGFWESQLMVSPILCTKLAGEEVKCFSKINYLALSNECKPGKVIESLSLFLFPISH